MAKIIKISDKPTFDVQEFTIENICDEGILFIRSKFIFKFDNVFGNLENRSRVLRFDKEESEIVEQVISASIDSGFCGKIVWKTKLTSKGFKLYKSDNDIVFLTQKLRDCQQLHLFPSPAGNYYNRVYDEDGNLVGGTNQTDLQPDIIFSL